MKWRPRGSITRFREILNRPQGYEDLISASWLAEPLRPDPVSRMWTTCCRWHCPVLTRRWPGRVRF